MVMDATVLLVVQNPIAERLGVPLAHVKSKVVELQHFVEMGLVGLGPICVGILDQVRHRGDRAPMIERPAVIRADEEQSPSCS